MRAETFLWFARGLGLAMGALVVLLIGAGVSMALRVLVLVFEKDLGTSLLYFGMFVVTLYIATERQYGSGKPDGSGRTSQPRSRGV